MDEDRTVIPRAATIRGDLARSFGLLFRDTEYGPTNVRALAHKVAWLYHRDRWRWSVRRRSAAVDRIPIDRPIFLLGVQGGGLTVLSRTLRRNPAVVSVSGNSSYWNGPDELGVEPTRMRRLPPRLWSSKFREDLDHPVFGSTHSSTYASDELLPLYRRTPADVRPEDAAALKRLIREHLFVYARDPAHARFVDKTQTYTVSLAYVAKLLEDCDPHFVLVTRNPYALALSAFRRPPSFRVPVPREEQIRIYAQHWATSTRLALEDAADVERFHHVRLEDFLADPRATVARICDFAGLVFDEDMLPQPHQRMPFGTWPGDSKWYPLREDRFLGNVTPADAAIVAERCGELAERLGYLPHGVTAQPEPVVAA